MNYLPQWPNYSHFCEENFINNYLLNITFLAKSPTLHGVSTEFFADSRSFSS